MKKIAIFFISLASILACQKQNENIIRSEADLDCTVRIIPTGEITTAESPLSKADNMTDDIYCVQVVKSNGEYFACGYFDNLESMTLFLKTGTAYTIKVAMIKNAKNLLGTRYALSKNGLYVSSSNSDVFYYECYNNTSSSSSYAWRAVNGYYIPLNQYAYCFKGLFYCTSEGSSLGGPLKDACYGKERINRFRLTNISSGKLGSTSYPTCDDWFYGELTVTPNGTYQTVEFPFKRVGFKLKYELSGVTDGEVTVTVKNSTRTFINNTTNTATYSSDTQFIAFGNTADAWKYADNSYTENLDVSVSWKRGIGVTQDLGTKTVQVKRNCLNNIKIALGNDDRGAGVNMTLESDASMNGVTTEVPVQ